MKQLNETEARLAFERWAYDEGRAAGSVEGHRRGFDEGYQAGFLAGLARPNGADESDQGRCA
jgi:flagellar biosynthesis/type III secretory pathway protein FliH